MRIFLASPKDAANYREAAKRVAERLNEEHGVKLGSEYFLEVVDWNTHVAPHQTLPESAILEEVEVGENDVFLGIAWLGFDQQTADGEGLALATERNFEIAFNYWRQKRPQHCFLCRSMRLPDKLTDIDGKAFHRVNRFFARFSLEGDNPVPYYEFDSATDLEEHLVSQLAALIEELNGGVLVPEPEAETEDADEPEVEVEEADEAEEAGAAAPASQGGTQFESKMEVGKAYEVSFLSIEIDESERIAQAQKENPEAVRTLFSSFRKLVAQIASSYGGEVFSWNEAGGLVIFWTARSFDHAIMTGLKVLHNLPVFNLDPAQNPVSVPIRTRAAAHDAVIIFQLPVERIESLDVDFVVELQKKHTEPAELSITRRLLERIDARLKPHFKFKDRYDNEPIYVCRLPSSDKVPSRSSLADFDHRLKEQTARVREILDLKPAELDVAELETASTAVDEIYAILNRYCVAFSSVDSEWPGDFLRDLGDTTADVMREESDTWLALRKCYVSGSFAAAKARKLEAIVRAASRRRSRPVVILEKLAERCRSLLGGAEAPSAPAPADGEVDDELVKKLEAFIRADALDNETILTEILLNRKHPFLEYIKSHTGDSRHQPLLDKLWATADLVLLDDLYSIRGRQRADEEKVIDALVSDEVADPRFRLVQELLGEEATPAEGRVEKAFAQAGLEAGEEDLQIVWRCVVLGHSQVELRNAAAFRLTPFSMWQAVSHPSIPIASIYAIGERVNKAENEDAKKIFFDCVRARLETAVETFRTRSEVSMLTKVILLLLDFSFLVETGYFERFDDLLRKFLDRSNQAGLKVDYFESLRKTLEQARQKQGDKAPSKPPAGLTKLPLTIQRRLAGESRYVYWFVTHPDPRIACETLRHVGLMNVERVLRLREVNKAVFTALLRKPELFTRTQALIAALNHPKCDQQFAGRHIPTLARSRSGTNELKKLSNNPSANPVVRSAAKRAMAGQARAGRR